MNGKFSQNSRRIQPELSAGLLRAALVYASNVVDETFKLPDQRRLVGRDLSKADGMMCSPGWQRPAHLDRDPYHR